MRPNITTNKKNITIMGYNAFIYSVFFEEDKF